jgi:hypothetical protein
MMLRTKLINSPNTSLSFFFYLSLCNFLLSWNLLRLSKYIQFVKWGYIIKCNCTFLQKNEKIKSKKIKN